MFSVRTWPGRSGLSSFLLPVGKHRSSLIVVSIVHCDPPIFLWQDQGGGDIVLEAGRQITTTVEAQLQVYAAVQLMRSPIEPIVAEFKKNRMWKGVFRGTPERMQMWYKFTAHMRIRDMYITHDAGFQRHRMCGPYAHFS